MTSDPASALPSVEEASIHRNVSATVDLSQTNPLDVMVASAGGAECRCVREHDSEKEAVSTRPCTT